MTEWTPMTVNTILYCRLWQETVAFYQEKLEMPVIFRRKGFVEFGIGSAARLSLADDAGTRIKSQKGKGLMLTFQVRDIARIRTLFQEKGLDPTPVSLHPWDAKVFYMSDPEGHRIEFWEPV